MLWLSWATGTCRECAGTWLPDSVLGSCETRQCASLAGGGRSGGNGCGIHLLIQAAQELGFCVLVSVGSVCWAGCSRAGLLWDTGDLPVGEALAIVEVALVSDVFTSARCLTGGAL